MTKQITRLIREGDYVAEVEISVIEKDRPGTPYLSVEDAQRLDRVRTALRAGDFDEAMHLAKVYRLSRVTIVPSETTAR